MISKIPPMWKKYGMIILGCLIYAVGMNWFVAPLGLFSAGCVGYAQLITHLIDEVVELGDLNLYGIIFMVLNIPLFFVAWKGVDRKFFFKTVIGVAGISILQPLFRGLPSL